MNDDELLAELRRAVEAADPPPASLRQVAVRAQSWDTGMQVMVESEAGERALLRSSDTSRDFSFSLDDVELYFTVEPIGDGAHRVFGGVMPLNAYLELADLDGNQVPVEHGPNGRFDTTTGHSAFFIKLTANGAAIRTPVITPASG